MFKIYQPKIFELKDDKYAPIFALVSGLFGGAYNVDGPPIIIYGTARQWEASKFRTYLQAVFFPINLFVILGHFIYGNYTHIVLDTLLGTSPFVIVAIILGELLHKKMSSDKMIFFVYILLLLIGVSLLIKNIFL